MEDTFNSFKKSGALPKRLKRLECKKLKRIIQSTLKHLKRLVRKQILNIT